MSKGTVKFFNESKGFGFINEEGTGKEYFVHVSGLVDEIRDGDEVEFELQESNKILVNFFEKARQQCWAFLCVLVFWN